MQLVVPELEQNQWADAEQQDMLEQNSIKL
jgi:hypothetical protein